MGENMTDKIHPAVEAVAREKARQYDDTCDGWEDFIDDAKKLIRAFLDATREPSLSMVAAGICADIHTPSGEYLAMHDQLRKETLGD